MRLDWINRIAAALSKKPMYHYQIITMGFDGRPRTLAPVYSDYFIADLVRREYAADYPRIPFDVRQVRV